MKLKLRDGVLSITDGSIGAQYSANVKVTLDNDPDYSEYTPSITCKFVSSSGDTTETTLAYDSDNECWSIPAAVYASSQVIMLCVGNTSGVETVYSNPLYCRILAGTNGGDVLPSDPETWQSYVDTYLATKLASYRTSEAQDEIDSELKEDLNEKIGYVYYNTSDSYLYAYTDSDKTTLVCKTYIESGGGGATGGITEARCRAIIAEYGYITADDLVTVLADYVKSADLATVATSGSYNDLTNKPTIPSATTVTQKLTSGTEIGAVNGTKLYAPSGSGGGSTVSADQVLTTGTEIGGVTIDGTRTPFFAPSGGSGGGMSVICDITAEEDVAYIAQKVDFTQYRHISAMLYFPTVTGGGNANNRPRVKISDNTSSWSNGSPITSYENALGSATFNKFELYGDAYIANNNVYLWLSGYRYQYNNGSTTSQNNAYFPYTIGTSSTRYIVAEIYNRAENIPSGTRLVVWGE